MNVRRRPASAPHRLHSSLVALAAVAVVSAAGLLAGRPVPAPQAEPPQAELIAAAAATAAAAGVLALDAEAGLDAAGEVQAESEADASPRKARKQARRSRQSLSVPYFSFARS
jgi:hypothetical protein